VVGEWFVPTIRGWFILVPSYTNHSHIGGGLQLDLTHYACSFLSCRRCYSFKMDTLSSYASVQLASRLGLG